MAGKALVGIIMGSKTDLEVLQGAVEVLREFGIEQERSADLHPERKAFFGRNHGGAEAAAAGQLLVETAQRPHSLVAVGLGDAAEAEGVVAQDSAAETQVPRGPVDIGGIAGLVGV